MALPILRDDALTTTDEGFALRVCLPWIRSLPLSSVSELVLTVDGEECMVDTFSADDASEPWWFVQDRLVLRCQRFLLPGSHTVSLSFRLLIPYLEARPGAPLTLAFFAEKTLTTGGEVPWMLSASAFNWTPEVIRAECPAPEIAVGIVRAGIASVIELELGQLWRSFPFTSTAEASDLRTRLEQAGGRVSIVGVSIDDWLGPTRRRDEDQRLAFLSPQLRTARDLGADGVRLPIGQAGPALLRRLQPLLDDLELTLYEELQGQQTPESPAVATAIDDIAALSDPRIRLLVDTSMLMPALPITYLAQLEAAGIPSGLLTRLADEWLEPATLEAVLAHLRSGAVPPEIHALYMNLLVRFGRSSADSLQGILPLVGAFHVKFWDLDDADGRVSQPLRDLGSLLRGSGFAGTMCSEWGGHEWLDDDPAAMTRGHLALARKALSARP